MSGIKLKPHEARDLVDLIISVARPRTPDEVRRLEVWMIKLQGGLRNDD